MIIRSHDQFDIWLFIKSVNGKRLTMTNEEIRQETGLRWETIDRWLRRLEEEGSIEIYEEDGNRIINVFVWKE